MSKKFVFGIDLGTTYSCIAYVDDTGHAVVVPNGEGDAITPSVVQIDKDGSVVVGQVAKDNSIVEHASTVEFVKRQIGRTAVARTIHGTDYSPEEISAHILKKISVDVANSALGAEVKDVVITCPAYFGDAERLATANAGRIAGFNVMEVIKEPLAAAIYFGATKASENKTYMVFDLGGGTFDVTIMRISEDTIEEICSDGDHWLGGKDWDDKLINYLKSQFAEEIGMEVDFSAEEEQELRLAAEKAKKNLTGKTSTAVAVNAAGERRRIEVTRAIFDELTSVERDRTFDITDRAIASARAKGVEVDEILLVGGSTLMPQIKEAIVAKYGIEPRSHDPSEAVAKGAALYAAWYYIEMRKKIKCGICGRALSECSCDPNAPAEKGVDSAEQQEAEKYRTELNVDTLLLSGGSRPRKTITATTKSYGIAVQDPTDHSRERIKNLILKNTSMPDDVFEAPGDFGTASENQSAVSIRIFESDQATTELFDLDPDYYLGEAELVLPPGLPLGSPLIVTLSLDRQGRLHVHGQDVSSGREVHADMQIKGALSEAQVKELEDKTRNLIIKDC